MIESFKEKDKKIKIRAIAALSMVFAGLMWMSEWETLTMIGRSISELIATGYSKETAAILGGAAISLPSTYIMMKMAKRFEATIESGIAIWRIVGIFYLYGVSSFFMIGLSVGAWSL